MASTGPLSLSFTLSDTQASDTGFKLNSASRGPGFLSAKIRIRRVLGNRLSTEIGTMAPFSAIWGTSNLTASLGCQD